MKSKVKRWHPALLDLPWLTRSEAASYLRWDIKTVDRNLVHAANGPVPGKIRFELQTTTTIRKVRLLSEDVYAICPPTGTPDKMEIFRLVQ